MIKHLAIIMDGNRRWAKKNNLVSWLGHKRGVEAVKTSLEFCQKRGIENLSLYTFSIENFKRSQEEVSYLFQLLIDQSLESLELFKNNNIKVKFIGDRELFPAKVLIACQKLEKETEDNRFNLNILFCYGGQQEITSAVKTAIDLVSQKKLNIEDINEKSFCKLLWSGDIPAPELIIRTGGMNRLSNFLLYQAAYSELYFTDLLWPEIKDIDLEKALEFFENSKRNFGA